MSRKQVQQATVVNIIREKFDAYVGRTGLGFTSPFGNPFKIGRDGSRQEVVEKYRAYFYKRLANDKEFKEQVQMLRGQKLGCFCAPRACHADVIAEYLNASTG